MRQLVLKLAEGWAVCGGVVLLAIMAITSINIAGFALDRIARLFETNVSGLPGYEDFVRLSIGSAALMFLPLCQARRGHVSVDLFVNMLPHRLQNLMDRLWLLATALTAVFLAFWMTLGMAETRDDNVLSPVLGWVVWPFYLPGIASLCLWAIVAFLQTTQAATQPTSEVEADG